MELPATIGKYELLEFLGGGMSHVYRARDTVIDRAVVVKILTDDSCQDADAKARFLQEAKLAGGFQHENIVSVFDYGEYDGKPFIVMEYLKGEDLRDAIRGSRLGGMNDRLRIALHIADALEYVHERAIVHRDIKPENIHIDPNGRVKLMDFGIAKTADLSLTRTGMAMGTPYYMSPEQISGSRTSHLVDIYAYGLLLFELLTGVRGVRGETMEQVFFQILNQTVDVAAMENAGVPPAVRDLVMRCTAKKPEERPQSFRGDLRGTARASWRATRSRPRKPFLSKRSAGARPEPRSREEKPDADMDRRGGCRRDRCRHRLLDDAPGACARRAWNGLHTRRNLPRRRRQETRHAQGLLHRRNRSLQRRVLQSHGMQRRAGAGESSQGRHHGRRGPRVCQANRQAIADVARMGARAARNPRRAVPVGRSERFGQSQCQRQSRRFARADAGAILCGPLFNIIGNAWEMVEGPVTPSANALAMFAAVMTPPPTAQEPWITMRGGSFDRALEAGLAYDAVSIPERFSRAERRIPLRETTGQDSLTTRRMSAAPRP